MEQKTKFQRLVEVMSIIDKSFKPKLNENIFNSEEFTSHGTYTVSNVGGYEIMLNDAGDAAKVRDAFGSDSPKTSDWLEIEYVPDEETGESEPVIDPNGYNIPLNQVMKINEDQDDIHSDEFNDDMDSWVKDYEKGFKDIPDDKIAILAQKFVNSEYTKDLMGLNKFIHDNYKKLYLKPESVSKLIDKTGNPDLKNQWIQATK